MNKDIQPLIEREAEKKYLNLDDGDFLDFSDQEKLKAFKVGASFALSLFKWRKVSDELPDADEAVLCKMKSPSVIVEGFIYNDNGVPKISTQADFEFEDYSNGEVTEWMPIPQID
ncbi:DUF551 domain-containing protein [Dysgonomonas capnocytophagoides]|uniref:DUF551 domain-containing protein n=1 Tax=Dysgonomonas capnocytophagoides TaxID=45254 RepID=A0A4Y8L212_9BACT|nr:DUF551 domain-containing protein [Dysgonomonas capnocytophagoides]TFD96695.1 DUF551 domain-containing protein [Dysgonomonas capnocytophagoides]